MNKILVICGPTATGKTSLGIFLAKKFNGEIISADSRQVYRGMDIGTGKEWGDDVSIWGYDLVNPLEEFSVSHFVSFARSKILEIQKREKLPIVVGGTGFYIKGLIDGIETADIPRNKLLRENLSSKSVDELFEQLSEINPIKAGGMNSSDRKNPRRLIRAIEIAQYQIDAPKLNKQINPNIYNIVQVGLVAPLNEMKQIIKARVEDRIKKGMKNEVQKLLENGVDWSRQSMYSLGYRQYRDFFEGGVSEDIISEEWAREEIKYVKRQITWFKKDKRINWFNVNDVISDKSAIINLCQEKLKFPIKQ